MVVVMKKVSEDYMKNVKEAQKIWQKALVFDVTLGGAMEKMDPSFPIEKVKIPGIRKWALSLNGVWEGLKVFSKKNEIDSTYFFNEKKLGKTRKCKSYGNLIGVKIGEEVLDVEKGIEEVFVKGYKYLLENRYDGLMNVIKNAAKEKVVVLLDYNEDRYPVSHAEMIKDYINNEM